MRQPTSPSARSCVRLSRRLIARNCRRYVKQIATVLTWPLHAPRAQFFDPPVLPKTRKEATQVRATLSLPHFHFSACLFMSWPVHMRFTLRRCASASHNLGCEAKQAELRGREARQAVAMKSSARLAGIAHRSAWHAGRS